MLCTLSIYSVIKKKKSTKRAKVERVRKRYFGSERREKVERRQKKSLKE